MLCKAGNGQFHLSQDLSWVLGMLYHHNNGNNNNDDGSKSISINSAPGVFPALVQCLLVYLSQQP